MRNILRYSIILLLFVFATGAVAQQPASPSDSGGFDYAKYRGVRKYIEGLKYILEPRMSGEMKNLHEIDQAAQRSFKQLSHRAVALKGTASLPAWKAIGGHQGPATGALSSGRSRDVAFGPGNVVYLATAGGGLWKTEDISGGGTNSPTWIPLTDRLPTLSLGSVAVDPSNQNVVYLGTGEKSPDGYDPTTTLGLNGMGDGLYKSTDGGLNWTKIADVNLTGDRISEVLIDPTQPQTIYVACNDARAATGTDSSGGVLKSTDGGATWKYSNLRGFGVLYMAMDPTDTKRLYVSGVGKIFRTDNGGDTWEQINTGLTGSLGRIAIDVSPASTNVLYASVGNNTTGQLGTNGLFVSADYGSNWKKLLAKNDADSNYLFQQPWFANAVAAYPTNAKIAIAGGLHVVRTADSGKSLSTIGQAGSSIHADIHNIIYNGPTNLYVCHDGGLSYSKSNGNGWFHTVNNGLATLEFVGVDADKDFTFVLGGTQDNGTNRAYINDPTFIEANSGDGGRTWISPKDSNICYTTQYEESFFRSLGAGRVGTWQKVTVSSTCPFYPRYDADERGEVIALGASSKIVVSRDGGVDGFAQKSTQTINNARAVRVFPTNYDLMWAGSGTTLWRSTDGGVNFAKVTVPSAGAITDIEIDPSNPQNLWICTQGYSTTKTTVFQSTDGGATVTAIPNFPKLLGCNAIARQHSTNRLFVGTDRGVVFTEDNGQNWYALADGMPNVPVNSMKIKGATNDKLLAGTYGRGMFWLDLEGLGTISVGETKTANDVIRFVSTYPNPVNGNKATVTFEIKDAGIVTSTLLDVMGREVKLIEKASYSAGTNQFEFAADDLASGTYIVLLTANGKTVSERIVVN
jgi:photosystem II stability/assembly factor-like uncharacterized protein